MIVRFSYQMTPARKDLQLATSFEGFWHVIAQVFIRL